MIVLAATADIHSPRYLSSFREAMEEYSGDPKAFILAGDIVEKNKHEYLQPVLSMIKEKYPDTPIIAVFGNEEYRGYEEVYRRKYPEIKWLDDEYTILDTGDGRVAIIGTRGALEKPTSWQARNMPWIRRVYDELPVKLKKLVLDVREREKPRFIVVVSHYGVCMDTLVGEPRRIWPYLANPRVIEEIGGLVDVVIHGHAHNSKKTTSIYKSTRIYNVALPANKRIVEVRLTSVKTGILEWFK